VWDPCGTIASMRHGIVEGEPGIFPAPIARLFQAIGRLFGHRSGNTHSTGSPPPPGPPGDDSRAHTDASTDVADLDPVRPDAKPDDPGR
jgi:hypothetical protein